MVPTIERIRGLALNREHACALRSEAGEMSYGQLWSAIVGLAGSLVARGIEPDDRVAIVLERSPELIVALLGTIAAGAAYVPIDPQYPRARIRQILDSSRPRLLLSSAPLLDRLELEFPRERVLSPEQWRGAFDPGPLPRVGPGHIAYLLYTSGSTGEPKGVVVAHSALENYLAWCDQVLPTDGHGVPLFASVAFDHSVTCIYPPLRRGEPLTLLPAVLTGTRFADALLDAGPYSFVKITPSHLRLLDPEQRARLGRSCKLLMTGGERADAALLNDVRRDAPELALMNHYGPTEATVGCCACVLPPGVVSDPVPIGQPITNMRVSLRDASLRECRPGEPGELYVSGPGIAESYWEAPQLTAAAFVRLPDSDPDRRWYRTGDLVCLNEAGSLVFLGRADRQVKILGHRIEQGAVEAALDAHPCVAASSVQVLRGPYGARLGAAVVARTELTVSQLKLDLAQQLIPAAVPQVIVLLERLPVNAHGKVDQAEIERLLNERLEHGMQAAAAHSDAEIREFVRARWSELVGSPVDLDAEFFESGGDSMTALAFLQAVFERFGVVLSVAQLFKHPSPRATSHVIAEMLRQGDDCHG